MTVTINFARGGNANCFTRSGWSDQEDEFLWSMGPRCTIALPCLDSGSELEVEADLEGFDSSTEMPLRVTVAHQMVGEFRLSGRSTIRFRIPPGESMPADPALELEHPVFRHGAQLNGDVRPLALCFRRMIFTYVAKEPRPESTAGRPTILVVGQSHTDALRQAHERQRVRGASLRFEAEFAILPANSVWVPDLPGVRYDLRVIEELGQLASNRNALALCSTIFGNGHFIFGATQHSQPFDFVIPGDPTADLAKSRQVVPYALVRERALRESKILLGFLSALGRRTGLPAYHIASPPPGSDNECLAGSIEALAGIEAGSEETSNIQIETPSFRYKAWRVFEDAAREVVESGGGTYLPPPPQALDAAGFLRKSMEGDGFHANADYGNCVLAQLGDAIRGAIR